MIRRRTYNIKSSVDLVRVVIQFSAEVQRAFGLRLTMGDRNADNTYHVVCYSGETNTYDTRKEFLYHAPTVHDVSGFDMHDAFRAGALWGPKVNLWFVAKRKDQYAFQRDASAPPADWELEVCVGTSGKAEFIDQVYALIDRLLPSVILLPTESPLDRDGSVV